MISFSRVREAYNNPNRTAEWLNAYIHTLGGIRSYNPRGINIFEEDWDNLIILDACRYDAFESVIAPRLEGELQVRISRGGNTKEWTHANFGPGLTDTVYVTQMSWIVRIQQTQSINLHYLDPLLDEQSHQAVADRALGLQDEYPNKRLIIHFSKPHHPFVGPTAETHLPSPEDQQHPHFFRDIAEGRINISDSLLQDAHRENLELIRPVVEELIPELTGLTVISSDHGELLGDRTYPIPIKGYGHRPGLYVDPLVRVPWYVCGSDERRTITADPPIERDVPSDSEVNQRLRNLGYKV